MSEGLAKLIPFVTVFVFANQFSSEIVGQLTLLIVTVEIFSIIATNNTPAVTRIDFFKLERDALTEQLVTQLSNSLIISLLLLFVFFPILIYKGIPSFYLILICVPYLRAYTTTCLALLQCGKETDKYLIAQLVFSFSYLITFFIFYKYGICSWIIAFSFGLFLQCLYLKQSNSFVLLHKLSIIPRNKNLSIALKGVAFMPQAIGWWLRSGAERYLIAFYLSVSILGQYALSMQISSIAVLFVTAINLAIVPEVNRHLSRGATKDILKVNKIYYFTFLMLLLGVLILWVGGYGYLSAYYYEYTISRDILWIACMSTLFQSFSMVLMNELYFRSKAVIVAKYVLCCFIVQAILQLIILSLFNQLYIVLFVNLIFSIALLILVINRLILERKCS
ncbi:lipopolysaccharide biosynthesis protein [Shewanella mangrovisoli]|uniref:lipopolysaccharide biosynthesis protein n=1 Tax=Shewanella mangrovisoli TaxID=2864211 RepID=UPI001C65F750|nr:hypothetical protein [Shewanella mangrovisoli]QYK10449.1 hypothetical protein K0H60_07150 [Shewanella mangrovisoli]